MPDYGGGILGRIRGDPVVPGTLQDPDRRRDPDRPDFPGDPNRSGFNPDGSFNSPLRMSGRGGNPRRPHNLLQDPFGGGGFM